MTSEKNDRKKNQDVFDIEKLRQLMEIMKANDVSKVDLQQDKTRVQLRRSVEKPGITTVVSAPNAAPVTFLAPAPTATEPVSSPGDDEKYIKTINSPMVGTFYSSANPDSPPYVQIGDAVTPEKTVCIVEAMKVFNEIQAETTGKIIAVLAKNGDAVEFGKPLFKVDSRG